MGKKTSFKSALLQAFETLVYHLMYHLFANLDFRKIL